MIEDKSELPRPFVTEVAPADAAASDHPLAFRVEAAAPIRLLVFPTSSDAANYLAHQPYSTYTCSEQHTQLSDSTCRIEPQAMLALENPTDAGVRFALSVTSP